MDPISILMAGTMLAGSLVSASGSLMSGSASREGAYYRANAEEQGGIMAQQQEEFRAQQYEFAAGESRGAAQREAYERRRSARFALSSLIAKAAASGGGATDATINQLGENISERGEYQALIEMYTGENRARGLEDEAKAARYTGEAKRYASVLSANALRYGGDQAQTASYYSAAGTLLSGVGATAKAARYSGGGGGGGKPLSLNAADYD